jgi:hypothetical protein
MRYLIVCLLLSSCAAGEASKLTPGMTPRQAINTLVRSKAQGLNYTASQQSCMADKVNASLNDQEMWQADSTIAAGGTASTYLNAINAALSSCGVR